MSEKPWCAQCGGSCFKMREHFGEGDHFPAIEANCVVCGVPTIAEDYTGEAVCEDCQRDNIGDEP